MKRIALLLLIMICLFATGSAQTQRGVARSLATERAAVIRDVEYRLNIAIPDSAADRASGRAVVSFRIDAPRDVVIDFADASLLRAVDVNGNLRLPDNDARQAAAVTVADEHIVIPASTLHAGENSVAIDFDIDQRLLNRRDNLAYTLSVPDKARRLFPCFDQPDMKATYRLTLTLPADWHAVSNSPVASELTEGNRTTVSFGPSEPLSTYLFAFAAGRLTRHAMTRDGRTIALYHCETDSARIAQCDEILGEVFASLDWLESYTGIPYPFAKYDLVIIPGFQFGGMEHTGATLYNDRVLFLSPQATLNERLARTSLIAHETAHMWFGDYVTMRWFGEVWTKEVFANYYAALMSEPLYPDIDHRLRFMMSYAPSAYDEDRTAGANPIQQQLDNLQDAGLVYGNIIYNKSPMMMRQLVEKIGATTFRQGIGRYLKQHAYGNATWDDLIAILDSLTTEDLRAWSSCWVDSVGMPLYRITRQGRTLTIRQEGPLCPQQICFDVDGRRLIADCRTRETTLRLPAGAKRIIPNADGMAYGYFGLDKELLAASIEAVGTTTDDLLRGATLINLHEALRRGDVDPTVYADLLSRRLPDERNPLLFSLIAGQLRTAHTRYAEAPDTLLEHTLIDILLADPDATRKVTALRAIADVADSPEAIETLYKVWHGDVVIDDFRIGDYDAASLSYQLAVRLPERADSILALQRSRLTSDNLRREFDFIAPALSPRQADRDALFELLLTPAGRSVEPWAESALYYLNHRYRRGERMRYVERGLEAVEDVKRTGDIFFPKRWVAMLLAGQRPSEAAEAVGRFLDARPDYPPMLRRKILMNVDNLPH